MASPNTRAFLSVAGLSLLAASSSLAQPKPGTEFVVQYGTVDRIDTVQLGPDGVPKGVGAGAVIGGLAGSYNSSHHHQVRDAAAGALAGALLTAAIASHQRKDKVAYQYTVKLLSGGNVSVVVEDGSIGQGDCVSVETGPSANVRRVSSVYCQNPGSPAVQGPEVSAKRMEDAADCHAAKDMALRARSQEEIDVAVKKVRIFCEH